MNVINLCKNIINFEYSKDSYKNNLLICEDINDYKKYENIKKICYITKDKDISIYNFYKKYPELDNYLATNVEKMYKPDLTYQEYSMVFLTEKNYIDDLTFIIAGYTSDICNVNRINCYLYGKIIQSTVDKHEEQDKINLMNAEKSKYMIQRNMYNQMYNVYRVIDQVNTEYLIKHRSDEYYIDMDEYIEIMKTNNKLIMNNLFFFGKDYYISDHLFGAKSDSIKNMIKNLKNILENKIKINPKFLTHTEKLFGIAYILNKYHDNELLLKEKEILNNNFYVYSCDRFNDYLVTTVSVPTTTKLLPNKYEKKTYVQKKYRIFIKKNSGYTELNMDESNNNDIVNNVRDQIMKYKSIEEIKY